MAQSLAGVRGFMKAARRSVLVTGASSGIGAELAEELARRGYAVWLAARRLDRLESVVARIVEQGGIAHAVVIDVANAVACAAAVRKVDDDAAGLDVVVANAGVAGDDISAWSGDSDEAAAVVATNLTGALSTLMPLLPRMKERRRGHLVGISSLAAEVTLPLGAVYGASKAALSFWLDSVAPELARHGVAVTVVHLGFVRSEMTAKNRFPMPWLQETTTSVVRIADAIEERRAWLRFPWPLALLTRVSAWLPRRWRAALVRNNSGPKVDR